QSQKRFRVAEQDGPGDESGLTVSQAPVDFLLRRRRIPGLLLVFRVDLLLHGCDVHHHAATAVGWRRAAATRTGLVLRHLFQRGGLVWVDLGCLPPDRWLVSRPAPTLHILHYPGLQRLAVPAPGHHPRCLHHHRPHPPVCETTLRDRWTTGRRG